VFIAASVIIIHFFPLFSTLHHYQVQAHCENTFKEEKRRGAELSEKTIEVSYAAFAMKMTLTKQVRKA